MYLGMRDDMRTRAFAATKSGRIWLPIIQCAWCMGIKVGPWYIPMPSQAAPPGEILDTATNDASGGGGRNPCCLPPLREEDEGSGYPGTLSQEGGFPVCSLD